MADQTKTIPPWTKLDCYECGVEYLASRTVTVTRSRFLCCCCETAERADQDGDNDLAKAKREGYMLAVAEFRRYFMDEIADAVERSAPGEVE